VVGGPVSARTEAARIPARAHTSRAVAAGPTRLTSHKGRGSWDRR
jgi:hypothetical protein